MATATLSATPRTETGKGVARTLRRNGRVPGVIYGHARDSQALSIDMRELTKLLEHIAAESTVIELDLGAGISRTLIREIQRHPVKRQILHVDFQELVAGEKVTVNIPIRLNGIPEGVRVSGGILSQVMNELTIRVDQSNIPDHVDVDVTNVTIGHTLHVRDITLPEGVECMDDADATIATVAAPKVVEEVVVAPVVEPGSEPELIRKTKAEEDAAAK